MKKLFFLAVAMFIFIGTYAQTTPEKDGAKPKPKKKVSYQAFTSCPFKDLKKDTLTMDSLLVWKSFYDSLGILIDFSKLKSYVAPDGVHKSPVLISSELNSPDRLVDFYEKMLNKDKKKIFSKKNMVVRDHDLTSSQRAIQDEPAQIYMIWIVGGDEPDSATIDEFPDTSQTNMTITEYLVWQLFNKTKHGEFADIQSTTICGDVCEVQKEGYFFPVCTFPGGVPKTNFIDPANSGVNLSSTGVRSVNCVAYKSAADSKKKELKKK
jgi:hypothetical protein